jgi:hypothetical protein
MSDTSTPTTAAPVAIAGILLGLAAVLGVVAVAYVVLTLSGHPDSSVVCANNDTTIGECLLSSQLSRSQTHETWAIGVSLAAGAGTAALAGGASLLLLLRRR